MNAPSVLRVIGGITLVVGSFVLGKGLISSTSKMNESKKKYFTLDSALDKQEAELEEKRRIRDELLNS